MVNERGPPGQTGGPRFFAAVARPLTPLGRRPDHDEAAVEPGDRPANEHQVVFRVDADDVEVAGGDALVAVPAGHADALLRPAAAAVGGVRRDGAALPGPLLDAVA